MESSAIYTKQVIVYTILPPYKEQLRRYIIYAYIYRYYEIYIYINNDSF